MPTAKHTTPVEYRDIPGFPDYRIGDDGSVWSRKKLGCKGGTLKTWKRLTCPVANTGYAAVGLSRNRSGKTNVRLVHRLLLEIFVGPCPPGMECCHRDGNPRNNCLDNLRWDTRKGNKADDVRNGKTQHGSRSHFAKITAEVVVAIRDSGRRGVRHKEIAATYGISAGHVWRIIAGQTWKHLPV